MLWGMAAWATGPTLYSNLVSLAPEAAGVLMSLNASVVQLGMAAGAVVGGIVAGGPALGAIGWTGAAAVGVGVAIATASSRLAGAASMRRERALEA
jgi:DHA1 family putative efflux transporter-like MFS transporter